MTIFGLSLHHGKTESRENLAQKFIFQLGTLYPHGFNECLIPLIYSQTHVTTSISTNGKAPPHPHNTQQHLQFLQYSLWQRANARNVSFPNLSHGGNSTFINLFDKTKFLLSALWLPCCFHQNNDMRREWKRIFSLRRWWFIAGLFGKHPMVATFCVELRSHVLVHNFLTEVGKATLFH